LPAPKKAVFYRASVKKQILINEASFLHCSRYLRGCLVRAGAVACAASDVSARIQGRITNCYCPAYVVALINSNGVSYFSFGCPSWDSTAAVKRGLCFLK